jgi:hypothetical protein
MRLRLRFRCVDAFYFILFYSGRFVQKHSGAQMGAGGAGGRAGKQEVYLFIYSRNMPHN